MDFSNKDCMRIGGSATGKMWEGESVKHGNFTDLGNYIIELPDFTDASILKDAQETVNYVYDHGDITRLGCSALVKRNSKGEVLVGRNMDVEISQYPAYVFKTTFGKYQTFAVSYLPAVYMKYPELQKIDMLDEKFVHKVMLCPTDVMNERGFFVETNMRTSYSFLNNYGLHSVHGETVRDDGTPWSELRACTITLPQLVAQNCATIEEALDFIKNSYDWYTIGYPNNPHYDGWNFCFVIGDATGNYGLLEIAQDTVSFIQYQYGQTNYYITPKWNAMDSCGSGHGRLNMVQKMIAYPETLEDAMDAMKPVMWRNETLWVGNSHREDSKTHQNPYDQIVFTDDDGNSTLDWRSDYVVDAPVLDDGRLIVFAENYENAKKSDYDPNILRYYDEALATGKLIVDDGSITFEVNGETMNLTQLRDCHAAYETSAGNPEKQQELLPYYRVYEHLLRNESAAWVQDDHNFEALKATTYDKLHTRYDAAGNYNPNSLSKYEKLRMFYGHGVEKNETPLRDDGAIWTTSLNVGANCTEKRMKIRFWENDKAVYSVAW